jgi:uncharacterized phage protein gp47/JayE
MPFGVDSTGLTIKTIEDIKGEIEDDLLANLDPSLVMSPDQPLGQINAAHSKKLAELWELGQVAYNGFNRQAADGAQLDNVGDITGTPREVARKTRVLCTVNLNASQSYTPGQLKANVVGQPTNTFVNESAITSTTSGNYSAWFVSEVFGPQVANAGTLTQITTPVSGWNSITNAADGVLGALAEEDGDYRVRQEDELFAGGSSSQDAIRVDLLQVSGVLSAYVYENVTMFTDASGVPAKACECIIFDGLVPAASNNEIAQAIWNNKAPGLETYGTSFGTATDSLGVARTVYFTRSTIKNVYLEYDIKVDATKFPIDGIQQVKDAAVKAGDTGRKTDDDIVALALRAAVLQPVVKGVTDVVAMRLGFAASPTNTENLTISAREIADFDTSRILVNLV